MKQIVIFFLSSLLVLLFVSSSKCARLQPSIQVFSDEQKIQVIRPTQEKPSLKSQEDLSALMGLEESCEDNDKDCLSRKMVLEAHLDYIYTQGRKPNS
ncbi:putative phytosulfokines 6 [Ipomoea triloba]|uniref:putative phytosulfokines 6 n=1 Tax=Ipomoea triloba TaxID=35885 RepID=UPI00125E1C75|nr:putative phytosulfokines 6 [Ipomoea triloba]